MTEILRTGGAFLSLRREGPHELPQKRSLALVSILPCLAAAEIAKCATFARFSESRDFRVFQHNRHLADIDGRGQYVRFWPKTGSQKATAHRQHEPTR